MSYPHSKDINLQLFSVIRGKNDFSFRVLVSGFGKICQSGNVRPH